MGAVMRPIILMLQGLPGSGKTTYARELVDDGWVRVNKDDLRAMMDNSKWGKTNEKRVLEIRDTIIRSAINDKKNVVVDDTNFDPRHIESLSEQAQNLEANFQTKYFDTPLEDCISRNAQRAKPVPVSVIMKMYNQYVAPMKGERAVKEYDENLEECIIVDVDGTLAHISGSNPRNPYDASRALEDTLDDAVASVVGMAYDHGYKVIILTGRHSGHLDVTTEWLELNGIEYDEIYCREEGDVRQDTIVKEELYRTHVEPRFNVKYVIDDRPSVCRMWRSIGLKTLQVGDPHVEF